MSEGVSDPPAQADQASRRWFLIATLFFFVWVGYLAYLALGTADPTVLSRPQLLVSTLDVIAKVDAAPNGGPLSTVTIVSVHYPTNAPLAAGQAIEVGNLPACVGWRGPDEYILPLLQTDKGYEVAPLPRSPGFIGTQRSINPPRIYRVTEETRAQLEAIPKP